jgi:hypothetical protein
MTNPLDSLRDAAIDELTQVLRTTGAERTAHTRRVAELFVDARALTQLADGSMDMEGKSHEFKMWVHEIYNAANVPAAIRSKTQSIVSYHVSNVARERYDDDEVTAHGLNPAPLNVRRAERRAHSLRLLRLFDAGGRITDPADAEEALRVMKHTVERFTPELAPKGLVRALDAALRSYDPPTGPVSARVPAKI